jgi:hypothetical protein
LPTPRRFDGPRPRPDRTTSNGRGRTDGHPLNHAETDGEDRLFREATLPPD